MKIQKHRILLNIYWASIYKDVTDKAYRSARLAKLGVQDESAGEKLESEISLTAEDESMLRRAMTGALAEIQTVIIREHFIWEQSHIGNNRNLSEDNVKITMLVPRNFDLAAVQPLAELIHDYIVQKAMFVWFSYTTPARSQEQMQLAQLSMANIKQLLRARVRMLSHGTEVEVNVGDTTTEVSEITLDKSTVTIAAKDATASVVATFLPTGSSSTLTWSLSPAVDKITLTPSTDTKTCTLKLTEGLVVQKTTTLVATSANGINAVCIVRYGTNIKPIVAGDTTTSGTTSGTTTGSGTLPSGE